MITGISEIDTEHQELLGRAIDIGTTLRNGMLERFTVLVAEFEVLLREHFAHEEAILAARGYPWLEQHQAVHASLLAEVEGMRRTPRLYTTLFQSLSTHVHEHDSAWAEWVT